MTSWPTHYFSMWGGWKRRHIKPFWRIAVEEVRNRYGVSQEEFDRPHSRGTATRARQQSYLTLWEMGYSYSAIGRMLSRDHSSIMHGCAKARRERG